MAHGERIAGVYSSSGLPRSRLRTRSGDAIGGGGLEEEPPMIGIGGGEELGAVVVDKPRIEFVGGECGMLQQALQEADVGWNTLNAKFAEAPVGLGDSVGKIVARRMRDELGQQ